MKNTFVKKKNHYLLTGLLFCAAALVTASAQNSFVTFSVDLSTNVANGTFNPATESVSVRGTFNNWSGSGGTFGDGSVQLTEQGLSAPYIYTNTVQDTFDANGTPVEYKFIIETNTGSGYSATYETLSSGYNRNAFLPTVSGATVVLPTPYFSDSGGVTSNLVTFSVDMHEQSYLGNFNPGSGDEITVEGNFQGWGTAHGALVLVNNGGTVYTNTFGITNSPYAVEEYKFVIYNPGTLAAGYESVAITNQDRDSNNRFFAGPQPAPLTLPLVDYSDTAYSPIIVSNITFSVDMSIVAATDTNFDRNTVTVDGSMNSWADGPCTNNPTAANTNIYTSSTAYSVGLGSAQQYQFRYKTKDTGSTVYDHAAGGGNRLFTAVNTNPNGTNYASIWNDASADDYFFTPQAVTFSVSMTNSSGAFVTPVGAVSPFNPATDNVYLNGAFVGWFTWETAQPVTYPAGYQMIRAGSSYVYTNTIIVNPTTVNLIYKYGTDPGGLSGGPQDNEAASGQNHSRVVRTLTASPYAMPVDTFGNQYNEPYFSAGNGGAAQLSVGSASGGTVPVSWLGRPGAHLQTKASLNSGSWVDLWATDGTNWNAGHYGTNGLVSVTNFPTSGGNTFFRVVKP
ncbi:MAG TPA: hypothetical protein VN784_17650 [Candidatus Limnocylindrales bacterium]|nr:hypothetical protein [Candidatus Limnocylindrales bacterium]